MIHLQLGTARIFVRPGATDMRKQINGLVLLVQEQMQVNPFEPALCVFCNAQRRVLKAVYWDRTGFCLWMKRLESGRFSVAADGRPGASPDRRGGAADAAVGDRFLERARGAEIHRNRLINCLLIVRHRGHRAFHSRIDALSWTIQDISYRKTRVNRARSASRAGSTSSPFGTTASATRRWHGVPSVAFPSRPDRRREALAWVA